MTERTTSAQPINLAEGYQFIAKQSIEPIEIIILRESVGWDGGPTEVWQKCIEQTDGVIIGVRDIEGTLVGMGRITPDPRHAVLCDLAVLPANQGEGIGRAIVLKRIQVAEEKRIPYLYTDLAENNPLRDTYTAAGFISTGGGLFRAKLPA